MSRRSAWFTAALLSFVAAGAAAVSDLWTMAIGVAVIGAAMLLLGAAENPSR